MPKVARCLRPFLRTAEKPDYAACAAASFARPRYRAWFQGSIRER